MNADKTLVAYLDVLDGDIAIDLDLSVEFDYTPGYPAIIRACPGDCEPGCPDEVSINTVKANGAQKIELCAGLHLLIDDGADLKELLSEGTMARLEEAMYDEADQIIEGMNAP